MGTAFASKFAKNWEFVARQLLSTDPYVKLCAYDILEMMAWDLYSNHHEIPLGMRQLTALIPERALREIKSDRLFSEFQGATVGSSCRFSLSMGEAIALVKVPLRPWLLPARELSRFRKTKDPSTVIEKRTAVNWRAASQIVRKTLAAPPDRPASTSVHCLCFLNPGVFTKIVLENSGDDDSADVEEGMNAVLSSLHVVVF